MELINPIKHMSATLNYRKYVTLSLSMYPKFDHYNTTHIIKGIWVSFHRQLTYCRRIEGDLALSRVQKGIREGAAGE
jgi:hypothetical protein